MIFSRKKGGDGIGEKGKVFEMVDTEYSKAHILLTTCKRPTSGHVERTLFYCL